MIGSDLKTLRQMSKLSRPKLAGTIRVHSDTIKYWENASRISDEDRVPNLILEVFGLSWKEAKENFEGTYPNQNLFTHTHAGAGARLGVYENYPEPGGRNAPKKPRIECGARTRTGGQCKAKVVDGKKRCRMHGGLSTGPKTVQGRKRISQTQTERWAKMRSRTNKAVVAR